MYSIVWIVRTLRMFWQKAVRAFSSGPQRAPMEDLIGHLELTAWGTATQWTCCGCLEGDIRHVLVCNECGERFALQPLRGPFAAQHASSGR